MVHRVDAHNLLREHALALPNVKLRLGARVREVKAEEGRVILEDGSEHTADLIVGADGIHSVCVHAVSSPSNPPVVTRLPRNIYRMLVNSSEALADPELGPFLRSYDWKHDMCHFVSREKRDFTLYACRGGELLNCATFVPCSDDVDNLEDGSWNTPGSPKMLHNALERWPIHFHRLIDLAVDGEIVHWAGMDRNLPDSFVRGRLALIGDAAHTMPPTHAAGAAIGFEDAAALGALFTEDISPDQVSAVLELFNELRYKRGALIKYSSYVHYTLRYDYDTQAKILDKIRSVCGPDARLLTEEQVIEAMWLHEPEQEAKHAMFKAGFHKALAN